jgi:hypothetical protein
VECLLGRDFGAGIAGQALDLDVVLSRVGADAFEGGFAQGGQAPAQVIRPAKVIRAGRLIIRRG